MKTIKLTPPRLPLLVLLLLFMFTGTSYAQSTTSDKEEPATSKIEQLYKKVTCSNHKNQLEEEGFKYNRMLKMEQTNCYIYSIDDEDISLYLYCYNKQAVHMAITMAQEDYIEVRDVTIKNKQFKKIKQTDTDSYFVKGAYTYIFNNKSSTIGIREKTASDN
ncbi:hypothetical protein ACFQZI_20215 [Mucilaginibacter lutimaris]|uniref:Uncharacterized protein n=1 Tax=Mucilaginibacter lutimaris TaxID=931629 RepID=A0ABW2ZM42_9SPHI